MTPGVGCSVIFCVLTVRRADIVCLYCSLALLTFYCVSTRALLSWMLLTRILLSFGKVVSTLGSISLTGR